MELDGELDKLKSLVTAGQVGAITLDTSTFDAQGLRLESGLLKQLEQFRDSPTKLIISEVVKEEVLSHLIERTRDAKRDIEKSLRQAKDYWHVEEYEVEDIKITIFDGREAEEIATSRFNWFIAVTSLEIIKAEDYLIVSDLIQKYFRSEPPFSEKGKKKNEFPDAIALISLEEWANQNKTKIIVVTSDNDWKKFCEASERLCVHKDLAGVLELFQLQDANDICRYLSDKYKLGGLRNVEKTISNFLEYKIYEFDICPQASTLSGLEEITDVEVKITDIEVNGFEFKLLKKPNIIFRPVNFDDDSLTVESRLRVDIRVECNFSFSICDSVSKDNLQIGETTVSTQTNLDVKILITFVGDLNRVGAEIEVDEVDVEIPTPIDIDFGLIDPN
jgi:hypothetical protein